MDCPVQPDKIIVVRRKLKKGQYFDPHFSNKNVIARFQPNYNGWYYAVATAKALRLEF